MNDNGEPTVSNFLQAARALIEQGWCQGAYWKPIDSDGRIGWCILGALRQSGRKEGRELLTTLGYLLTVHLPNGFNSLDDFNDAERTTKKRVLALFDRALAEVTK